MISTIFGIAAAIWFLVAVACFCAILVLDRRELKLYSPRDWWEVVSLSLIWPYYIYLMVRS